MIIGMAETRGDLREQTFPKGISIQFKKIQNKLKVMRAVHIKQYTGNNKHIKHSFCLWGPRIKLQVNSVYDS